MALGEWHPSAPRREDHEPRYVCLACHDETHGWRPFWCPGLYPLRDMVRPEHCADDLVDCGRRQPHSPHAYVARCHCYPSNPVALARRERERVRAQERARRSA